MLVKQKRYMKATSAAQVTQLQGKAPCAHGTVRLCRQPNKTNCIAHSEQISGGRMLTWGPVQGLQAPGGLQAPAMPWCSAPPALAETTAAQPLPPSGMLHRSYHFA